MFNKNENMETSSRRELLISKAWIQAVMLVMLFGFFVMGLLAYYTYTQQQPPIPTRVLNANGATLFTASDITAGQELFLKNGLMEYGSIFGHGAWLGPDFTTDYLHRAAGISIDYYGGNMLDTARLQTIAAEVTNLIQDLTTPPNCCERVSRPCTTPLPNLPAITHQLPLAIDQWACGPQAGQAHLCGYTGAGRAKLHKTEHGRIVELVENESTHAKGTEAVATEQFKIADTRSPIPRSKEGV
jgi:hypothetical protein